MDSDRRYISRDDLDLACRDSYMGDYNLGRVCTLKRSEHAWDITKT